MKDFLTEFCLVGAAVMFAAWVVLANMRRIACAADALAKISRARIAAFLAFVAIATVCAQKPGGGDSPSSHGGDPPDVVQEGDGGNCSAEVTNLCFTGISVSSNVAVLSLAWPINFLADGSCLDFFAKVGSLTNDWEWIGYQTVSDGDTNLEVSVVLADLPGATNAAPSAAFFRVADRATDAATMRDWDGDGIPDVYEHHNGTNPYVPDAASASRLMTVGAGGDYADLASALAASTNYSIVSLPAGEMLLSNWIVMPEHPVMLTGPDGGYAVLRSTADIVAVLLDGGQTEETLFRNLILVLEHEGGFQAGFWIGGNLPWSGVGATPSFENVRIRAPRPGTLYYGWHYYRDDGGTSLLTDCVMNAAGATSVIGVYAKGGPEVVLDGCHFVNFPVADGNYATYFQDGINIAAEYAAPETGLSWAGYPLDGEYSAIADSDCDGISDFDEIFTYDTDPWLVDSDGDGVPDGDEVNDGTDPRVFGSFLRHVTVVATADDSLSCVTNYVAWGVAAHGWETNDVAAFATSPGTNEFIIASSNATVYAKAYRDMNHNGEYDEGADILLSKAVPASSTSIISFAFGDVDGDGVSDAQELAEGTGPYDAGNFRFSLTVVFENSDTSAAATNLCEWGLDAAWLGSAAVAFAQTTSIAVDAVVTNGVAYAMCMRDFNSDGEYTEEDDVLYVRALTRADNGKTVVVAVGDLDSDGIPDGEEVEEGTDPCDAKNYCFNLTLVENGIVRTTNDLSVVVKLGDETFYGPEAATNRTFEAYVGHVVVTNGASPTVYLWDDANTNGVCDAEEPCVTQRLLPNGHDGIITNTFETLAFDHDRDGILDWWEELHADAGLSATNSADAWLDPDGDGLINLHEYWADCDPFMPDGSNTVLSVMARSVDGRIAGKDANSSKSKFVNYMSNAANGVFVANTNFWLYGVDTTCASPWQGNGNRYQWAATLITPRHIICATHLTSGVGTTYWFVGKSGTVYTRTTVSRCDMIDKDISILMLNAELPSDDVVPARLLPANYAEYIGKATGLPRICFNQEEKAVVQDVRSIYAVSASNAIQIYGAQPHGGTRVMFYEAAVSGDSSNPCFLIVYDQVVLTNVTSTGPGFNGTMLSDYIDEIQGILNSLATGENYSLQFIDLGSYSVIEGGMP